MTDKDLGTRVIVMELPLPGNEKMLFFATCPVYPHSILTEEEHEANFYYYNSSTCPTNWLQDLVKVVHIDEKGEIDSDPHGVFRLVSVLNPGEYEPEMAISGNKKVVDCIVDSASVARSIISDQKHVNHLLNTKFENVEDLHKAWLNILYNKQALYLLSKTIYEEDEYFNIKVEGDGYIIDRFECSGASVKITPKSKEEMDRVKFILEFDVITACNY